MELTELELEIMLEPTTYMWPPILVIAEVFPAKIELN